MKKALLLTIFFVAFSPLSALAFTNDTYTASSLCNAQLLTVADTTHSVGFSIWDADGTYLSDTGGAIFSADDAGSGNEPQQSALPIGWCENQDPDRNFAGSGNGYLAAGTYTITESDFYQSTACDGSGTLQDCLASPYLYDSKTFSIPGISIRSINESFSASAANVSSVAGTTLLVVLGFIGLLIAAGWAWRFMRRRIGPSILSDYDKMNRAFLTQEERDELDAFDKAARRGF